MIYKLDRWLPVSPARKLDLYLDLEAIAFRMAVENSFRLYGREDHPCRPDGFPIKYIEPHHRVLDLGCGDGHLTGMLATAAKEVVGIDHDAGRIEMARKTHPGATFICGDAIEYLRAAPKFDVLFLSHILEHIDEPEAFLSSVTPHFDLIYIEVPDFEATPLNKMRLARERRLIYSDSDHVSESDREELKKMISSLSVIEEDYRAGVMRLWLRIN